MTDYLSTKKRISCLQELPLELRTKERQPPPCFVPSEETCPYCPGPTPPDLNSQEIVTTQATVFQDFSTGFHNFNNRVILTLPLCELLLSGLANKTTTGLMLDTLSLFNDNRYHHQIVRRAFHHFLSLTNFKFDFYCHQCGYNPAVVVADANWKLAFDVPRGVFHFSCVHGIVYYMNILFWTESARDHTDGLLSFKRFPTCYISDVAGQVARHTNNRTKQILFQPNDGRLCARTPDNIELAANRQLHVDMQWVLDFKAKQIKIYDSLMLFPKISDRDMDILRSGILEALEGMSGDIMTDEEKQWHPQAAVKRDGPTSALFEKGLKLPAFLSMDKDNQDQTLQALQSWQGETDEDDSPHKLFNF
ncbi:hypothetical protein NQZ68_031177 [Dissostichus eleginoides]|nr:hypothetical protein NQZ68_031177 [Dissostichus eleginoides]